MKKLTLMLIGFSIAAMMLPCALASSPYSPQYDWDPSLEDQPIHVFFTEDGSVYVSSNSSEDYGWTDWAHLYIGFYDDSGTLKWAMGNGVVATAIGANYRHEGLTGEQVRAIAGTSEVVYAYVDAVDKIPNTAIDSNIASYSLNGSLGDTSIGYAPLIGLGACALGFGALAHYRRKRA